MMIPLLLAGAVAGLAPRPPELTGGDPAGYSAKLAGLAMALAAQAQGEPCASAQAVSVAGVAMTDVDLASSRVRKPEGGGAAWSEAVRVEGCGRQTLAKVIVAKLPQGWGGLPLPPGMSVASFRLYQDVTPQAAVAAEFQRPDLTCDLDTRKRTLRLADTALTAPYSKGQPWSERWTFNVCGQDRPVDIDFTPAPDGGTNYHLKVR